MSPAVVLPLQPDISAGSGSSHGLRGLYSAPAVEDQIIRRRGTQAPDPDINDDVRPSIRFQPCREDFDARVKRQAEARGSNPIPSLPYGFPSKILGKRVWDRQSVGGIDDFMMRLSEEEVEEISIALSHFVGLPGNLGPDEMCPELFPLPTLGEKLREVSCDLHTGRGMVVLRGIDPARFTPLENVLLLTGLTSYIGNRMGCQDRFGNMLTHLVDMSFMFGEGSKRTPAFTGEALPYHNDVCDILAMYAQESATNGGESMLVSSAAVYNEIAATRPDVIRVLADPVWIYDKDELPGAWKGRPILFSEPTHGPFFCYSRQKITGSEHYPLSAGLPAMTEAQAEALDLVHYVAEAQGLTAALDPGDVLLYNNLGVLHGRKAFTDAATNGQRRHIMRLWLRSDRKAWNTPPELQYDWHRVYGDSERRRYACWKIRPEDMDVDRVIGHKMTCF